MLETQITNFAHYNISQLWSARQGILAVQISLIVGLQ